MSEFTFDMIATHP